MMKSDPVYVKPYVKKFIEAKGLDKASYILFCMLLRHVRTRRDNEASREGLVPVIIPMNLDDWNRYGFTLSLTNEVIFRTYMEAQVKQRFELELVAAMRQVKRKNFVVKDIIASLRDEFDIDEMDMSSDLINRHMTRFMRDNEINPLEIKKTYGRFVHNA